MDENEVFQGNDISLFDLWEKLRDGWKAIVAWLALGVAGAVAGVVLIPPTYEAVAVIQIGIIGSPSNNGVNSSVAVEPPSQAVERMKTPAFQRRVAARAGDQAWQDSLSNAGSAGTDDIRLQVMKGTVAQGQTPLVELRAVGQSPEVAKTRATESVAVLAALHEEMAAPVVAKMNAELKVLREKLAISESESAKLAKIAATSVGVEERLSPMTLMGNVRRQKETDLRQSILGLEMALVHPATLPTKAIEEIFVSARPIAPKKMRLLAFGFIGGLLAGVLWVFIIDACRRARASRDGN